MPAKKRNNKDTTDGSSTGGFRSYTGDTDSSTPDPEQSAYTVNAQKEGDDQFQTSVKESGGFGTAGGSQQGGPQQQPQQQDGESPSDPGIRVSHVTNSTHPSSSSSVQYRGQTLGAPVPEKPSRFTQSLGR